MLGSINQHHLAATVTAADLPRHATHLAATAWEESHEVREMLR